MTIDTIYNSAFQHTGNIFTLLTTHCGSAVGRMNARDLISVGRKRKPTRFSAIVRNF